MRKPYRLCAKTFLFLLLSAFFLVNVPYAENRTDVTKTIVLNFDDGPKPAVLKELLPVLKKYGVPGTFFMEGAVVNQNRELVRKMHEDGFEIENHSWGHENFIKLILKEGPQAVINSVERTSEAIHKATGRKPRFFRPPFWEINAEAERLIREDGYELMKLDNPDVNTLDYEDTSRHRPAEALIARVQKLIAERERRGIHRHVLVFHELGLTAKALNILIPYFRSQGYEFIRLDEK